MPRRLGWFGQKERWGCFGCLLVSRVGVEGCFRVFVGYWFTSGMASTPCSFSHVVPMFGVFYVLIPPCFVLHGFPSEDACR